MLAGEGLSINAMISVARNLGGGYRYQEMRNDANKYMGTFKYERAISALRPETVVPRHLMTETTFEEPAKYRVFGWATVYDDEADKYYEVKASYYTNEIGDAEETARQFTEYYGGRYKEEGLEVTDFRRRFVEHNEDWDY